jgi:predicted MPP superfamily phosphohydrolase
VLRNSILDVHGLQIAGIDDLWSGQLAPERVLPHLDRRGASIALCHNPDALDLPAWNGYSGWILAGHTHGGQCSAPWLGPPILPVHNKRYTSGEIALEDGRRLYINRGLGHLHRVRFNCRPEITVFALQSA